MQQIPIDSALVEQLDQVNSQVDLCDPSGRKIGYFVPTGTMASKEAYEWARNAITDEDIERARQDPRENTIEEIHAKLDALKHQDDRESP